MLEILRAGQVLPGRLTGLDAVKQLPPDRPIRAAPKKRPGTERTRYAAPQQGAHRCQLKGAILALVADLERGERAQQAIEGRRMASAGAGQLGAGLRPFGEQIRDP